MNLTQYNTGITRRNHTSMIFRGAQGYTVHSPNRDVT